jgi:hypothetical protein
VHLVAAAGDGGDAIHEGGRLDSEGAAVEEGVGAGKDDPADVQEAAARTAELRLQGPSWRGSRQQNP